MGANRLMGGVVFGAFLIFFSSQVSAAVFTVTNTDDAGAGSLRQAIIDAETSGGSDDINFDVTGTITLNSALPTLTQSVSLLGPGANQLTIDANGATTSARIFTLDSPADDQSFNISGLTLTGGRSAGGPNSDGGAIRIESGDTLDLAFCTFTNNDTSIADRNGGAIDIDFNATVTIDSCTFSNNNATDGGAIQSGGSLSINNSTFSSNEAKNTGGGGAVLSNGGDLVITNSTFNNNKAEGSAGALYTSVNASISNSTFAANEAGPTEDGGAIYIVAGANVTIDNVTVSGNTAGSGAGISAVTGTGTIKNTILANNTGGNCDGAVVSAGNNIDSGTSCGLGSSGDQSSTDPLLATLQNNSGPTRTMALQAGSPAIDKGSCTDIGGNDVFLDQRGSERPAGTTCDIGAFEVSVCGDDILGADEECDDANTIDTDDCTAACKDNICGDGSVLEGFEDCDDGNTDDGDGCDSTCVDEEGVAGIGGCALIRR